eukprot:scaffold11822_cov120-Isochrysis_galbana.AAC.13
MVPLRIDPFEPTAAEMAGDEPRSEQDLRTERQASTRLSASRATTPYGTHKKANILHEPLADTITQTTTPQEETSGDEPQAAHGKQPLARIQPLATLSTHLLATGHQQNIHPH